MNTEDMAKSLVAAGTASGAGVITANLSTVGGLTVTAVGAPAIAVGVGAAAAIAAVGVGAYLGYDAIKNKLDGSK